MRLINVRTYEVVEFPVEHALEFAILSHTWGDGEVTFQEMMTPDEGVRAKSGFRKIELTCSQALKEGINWAWVDTCCIDKTSSVELSEAINSMFRWYQQSVVCYVYLADLSDPADSDSLGNCRWFTRGWCLQELLAPTKLVFYSQNWDMIGSRNYLARSVSNITGIDVDYLTGFRSLDHASIATKMSWAASRQCTRVKDRAYSLLGIFDVNLPLLYGEREKAFLRLQEEIWKETDDHSLLAWTVPDDDYRAWKFTGVFAESPDDFKLSKLVHSTGDEDVPSGMTKKGLSLFTSPIELPSFPVPHMIIFPGVAYKIPLRCSIRKPQIVLLAARLHPRASLTRIATPGHIYQNTFAYFEGTKGDEIYSIVPRTVYIHKRVTLLPSHYGFLGNPGHVRFQLGGNMRPQWYDRYWKVEFDKRGFPTATKGYLQDLASFMKHLAGTFSHVSGRPFFILPLGDPDRVHEDTTSSVIRTSESTDLRYAPTFVRFLLQTWEEPGSIESDTQVPVEIRCGMRFAPHEVQASIGLVPWSEEERSKAVGIRQEGDSDNEDMSEMHGSEFVSWMKDNMRQAPLREGPDGLMVIAEASLGWMGTQLHVEMLMEEDCESGYESWSPFWVSPEVRLHCSLRDV